MKNRGMTLFIAVVIMGILLFISFAVVNITLKATLFASSGRDSQYAFYAADAGLECALYWDTKFDPSKFDPSACVAPETCPRQITCNNSTMWTGNPADNMPGTSTPVVIGGGNVSTFYFLLNGGANPTTACAIVTVIKSGATTYVKSKGYNTCDIYNPRRVERGVEATY